MSAALEQAYRRALRWYPRNWRTRNEDAALGTLMDVADGDDRAIPAKGELRNLRASALRARVEFLNRVYPASVRDRVAAIAIGTGFAMAAWSTAFSVTDTHAVLSADWWGSAVARVTFGPFTSFAIILYALWVLAFAASLIGWTRVSRILLVISVLASVVARFGSEAARMTYFPSSTLVVLLAIFALFGAAGSPRPTIRWRVWVSVAAGAAIGVLALVLAQDRAFPNPNGFPFFERGFFNGLDAWMSWLMVAMLGLLVAFLVSAKWRWAAVTAWTSAPWIGLYLFGHALIRNAGGDAAFWVTIAILIVAAVAGISLHRRGYRITITRA